MLTSCTLVQNAASDIAAQVAAALALSAKVARDHGTAADKVSADRWETLAVRAYNYAQGQYNELDGAASCSVSSAKSNCQGSGCGGGRGVRIVKPPPKMMYLTNKI